MAQSPAAKRLMREVKELHEATDEYHAYPLEDNLFEWHFTVRGPADTEFAGGRYHGRILLPQDYPMKPPHIMLLTPNGRFEVGKKICLTISAYHPEYWQPSWSIRTVLLALISFMPTKGQGAVGALDHTPEERKNLAKQSENWTCSSCNVCMKSALANGVVAAPPSQEDMEAIRQFSFKGEKDRTISGASTDSTAPPSQNSNNEVPQGSSSKLADVNDVQSASLVSSVTSALVAPAGPSVTPAKINSPPRDTLKFDILIFAICVAIVALMYHKFTREPSVIFKPANSF